MSDLVLKGRRKLGWWRNIIGDRISDRKGKIPSTRRRVLEINEILNGAKERKNQKHFNVLIRRKKIKRTIIIKKGRRRKKK